MEEQEKEEEEEGEEVVVVVVVMDAGIAYTLASFVTCHLVTFR